jgi:Putative sensor
VLGVFIGTATFTLMVVLMALSVSLLITFPLALPFAWALFVVARGIGHVERSRYAALLGVEMVDPVPPLRETSLWRRLIERVKTRPRWREIVYGVVRLPLSLRPGGDRPSRSATRDQPGRGRGQRRGGAAAHRARPTRWSPAAAGGAGRRPGQMPASGSRPTPRVGARW